jgi:predicted RNase H-like nuclease
MTTFIGIDAFPAGWVAVYLEKKTHRFHYAATTDHLLDVSYQRAMIDIPIGLPQRGYRDCDLAAKAIIGPSVFLGARWNVWGFESYEAANAHYRIVKDTCIHSNCGICGINLKKSTRQLRVKYRTGFLRAIQNLCFGD